jgi:hypothetical protein
VNNETDIEYDIDQLMNESDEDSPQGVVVPRFPADWLKGEVYWTTLEEQNSKKSEPHQGTWQDLYNDLELRSQGSISDERLSLVTFRDNSRKSADAEFAMGAILDLDDPTPLTTIRAAMSRHKMAGVIYPTKSHTVEKPRHRVIIPFESPVDPDRYTTMTRFIAAKLELTPDFSSFKLHQFQQFPINGITLVKGMPVRPEDVPGGSSSGKSLVAGGSLVYPAFEGPDNEGPVSKMAAPDLISKLMDDQMVKQLSESDRIAAYLSQVCVLVGSAYVVRTSKHSWAAMDQRSAISVIKEKYSKVGDQRIEERLIEEVFRRNVFPVCRGRLASPVGSQWVRFKGERYLNVGFAPRIAPGEINEDARAIIAYINANILCDYRAAEEIAEDIADPKSKSVTRWLWHWIANQYQHIGRPSSTAVWLYSNTHGVGKNIFGDYLSELLGDANTVKANTSEMTGEWSDWLVACTLVVADEIGLVERKQFRDTLKGLIGNSTISVRERRVGQYMTTATQSWLFYTNSPTPISLEEKDRRHTFIACEEDLDRALKMIQPLRAFRHDMPRRHRALAGLGTFLMGIEVDETFIERAITTKLKQDVVERTRPSHELWIREVTGSGQWALGAALLAAEAWPMFCTWAEHTNEFKPNRRAFFTGMSSLARQGILRHHRGTGGAITYYLDRIPDGIDPREYTPMSRMADKIRHQKCH